MLPAGRIVTVEPLIVAGPLTSENVTGFPLAPPVAVNPKVIAEPYGIGDVGCVNAMVCAAMLTTMLRCTSLAVP